jgi:hypothetical protein
VSALEGNLVLVVEHVGGHVGDDDAPGGEPVPVGVEVGVAEVVGDVLVPVVGLCDDPGFKPLPKASPPPAKVTVTAGPLLTGD